MTAEEARVEVRVVPGAPRNQVAGIAEGVWRIKIAAPPEGGKANEELIGFLAETLAVPRRQVWLVRGHTARRKVLSIAGISTEAVANRLQQASRR